MKSRKYLLTVGEDRPSDVGMTEYVDMAEAFWCTTRQSYPTDALSVRVEYIENKMFDQQYANYLQNHLINDMISREKELVPNNEHISRRQIRRQAMIFRMRNILHVHARQSCWNAIATFPPFHKKAVYQLYWFLQQMNIPHNVILHILEMVHIKDIPTPFLYISLPQDIIKHVLSFINFQEQIITCSLVSTQFNTLLITLNNAILSSTSTDSGDEDWSSMDNSSDDDGQSTDSTYTVGYERSNDVDGQSPTYSVEGDYLASSSSSSEYSMDTSSADDE